MTAAGVREGLASQSVQPKPSMSRRHRPTQRMTHSDTSSSPHLQLPIHACFLPHDNTVPDARQAYLMLPYPDGANASCYPWMRISCIGIRGRARADTPYRWRGICSQSHGTRSTQHDVVACAGTTFDHEPPALAHVKATDVTPTGNSPTGSCKLWFRIPSHCSLRPTAETLIVACCRFRESSYNDGIGGAGGLDSRVVPKEAMRANDI
ncbi:hypothetical protein C8F01DRAFT_635390 [Mycena amicta]|nr:hypothetical protein C8F01DRAFT_635390 [Mycena amicta]